MLSLAAAPHSPSLAGAGGDEDGCLTAKSNLARRQSGGSPEIGGDVITTCNATRSLTHGERRLPAHSPCLHSHGQLNGRTDGWRRRRSRLARATTDQTRPAREQLTDSYGVYRPSGGMHSRYRCTSKHAASPLVTMPA